MGRRKKNQKSASSATNQASSSGEKNQDPTNSQSVNTDDSQSNNLGSDVSQSAVATGVQSDNSKTSNSPDDATSISIQQTDGLANLLNEPHKITMADLTKNIAAIKNLIDEFIGGNDELKKDISDLVELYQRKAKKNSEQWKNKKLKEARELAATVKKLYEEERQKREADIDDALIAGLSHDELTIALEQLLRVDESISIDVSQLKKQYEDALSAVESVVAQGSKDDFRLRLKALENVQAKIENEVKTIGSQTQQIVEGRKRSVEAIDSEIASLAILPSHDLELAAKADRLIGDRIKDYDTKKMSLEMEITNIESQLDGLSINDYQQLVRDFETRKDSLVVLATEINSELNYRGAFQAIKPTLQLIHSDPLKQYAKDKVQEVDQLSKTSGSYKDFINSINATSAEKQESLIEQITTLIKDKTDTDKELKKLLQQQADTIKANKAKVQAIAPKVNNLSISEIQKINKDKAPDEFQHRGIVYKRIPQDDGHSSVLYGHFSADDPVFNRVSDKQKALFSDILYQRGYDKGQAVSGVKKERISSAQLGASGDTSRGDTEVSVIKINWNEANASTSDIDGQVSNTLSAFAIPRQYGNTVLMNFDNLYERHNDDSKASLGALTAQTKYQKTEKNKPPKKPNKYRSPIGHQQKQKEEELQTVTQ